MKIKKLNLFNSRNFFINDNKRYLSEYNSTIDINNNNYIKSYYKSSSNINEKNKRDNEIKFNSYEKTTINTFSTPKTTSSERNIFRKKINSKTNLLNNRNNNNNYYNNYKTIFNNKHYSIIKDKFINAEKKLQKIKSFSSSNRTNTYNNVLNIKNINNYDCILNKRKLLLETNKNFFPKTFEINKKFILKNNTSILSKDEIKKIYDF